MRHGWLTAILQSLPSLVFFALLRTGMDMQTAGWIGSALAAVQLGGFFCCRICSNPIALGINVHLLLITPLIAGVFRLGSAEIGSVLVHHSHRSVLVTILLAGIALTLLSPRGFLGGDVLPASSRWTTSGILLLATVFATIWAFTSAGSTFVAVAVPVIALFCLRRLLLARFAGNRKLRTAAAREGLV